jgi:hypothetical protein
MNWDDELPYWYAAGFDVAEAWEWHLCGYGVPDAIAHGALGVVPDATLKALRHLGIAQTPQNYKRWKGLNERQIRRAIDRGFQSAEDFEPYEKTSIDADYVRIALQEIDEVVAPKVLVRYHELRGRGLEKTQAILWMETTEMSVELVELFVKNRLSPTNAGLWYQLGLPAAELNSWLQINPRLDPASVSGWLANGIGAELARWFLARKVSDPDDAKRWLSIGEEITVVDQWIQLKDSTPELAKAWHQANYLPSDAAEWIDVGMNPLQAKRWQKLGKEASDVTEWMHYQFDIEEALTWLTAHPRVSALVARRRRDAGVKPNWT